MFDEIAAERDADVPTNRQADTFSDFAVLNPQAPVMTADNAPSVPKPRADALGANIDDPTRADRGCGITATPLAVGFALATDG